MKPHHRVSPRYLKRSSDFVYVREDDDKDHFYVVLYRGSNLQSELGFINARLKSFDLSKPNALTNASCITDVKNLIRYFPSLEKRERVSILIMHESDLSPEFHGRGIGKRLYLECMREGWEDNGRKPFIFVPHYCISGKTSGDAKRVWTSLARKYPSSGDCIAVLESPVNS